VTGLGHLLFAPGFFGSAPVRLAVLIGGLAALVSGAVGAFTVLRGQSYAGHALADIATSMTLPVVGALLIFSLMIGPPAAARSLTSSPLLALALSVAIAVGLAWVSIAASYQTNWPVGFFVGVGGAVCYAGGRGWSAWSAARWPAVASA